MDLIDLSDSESDVIDLDGESNEEVIEICDIDDYKSNAQYDSIFKECALLGEFIEKCLDLENTQGMIRVINRSLIPEYYRTSQAFRESNDIKSVLYKSIRQLDSDPDHKFSHVKELCSQMKAKSKKLDERLAKPPTYYLKRKRQYQRRMEIRRSYRKKKKSSEISNVILSDDSDGFEVPIVNLDEYESQETMTGVPVQKGDTINNKDEIIEVEIDMQKQLPQDPGSTNAIISTEKIECPTLNTDLGKENLNNNNNSSQGSLQIYLFTADNLNHNKEDTNLNRKHPAESRDSNLKTLEKQLDKDNNNDTEISSTEISSTVQVDDKCDSIIKDTQDSDLIVLEDETELVTTTQRVNEETIDCSLATDDKCRVSNTVSENKNTLVLDETNICKSKLSKEVSKEKVSVNTTNMSKEKSSVGKSKSITSSVASDLIVLDDDEIKEKPISKNKELVHNNDLIIIDDEDDLQKDACNNNSIITDSKLMNEENLLIPRKAEDFEGTTEDKLMMRIKEIEAEIRVFKDKVAALEEEEVNHDSIWSPYIQCEKYKLKIVMLYKELCKLTGERAVKRREVRLKAANSRSQLCVNKLEELINSNIGRDGLPHFPDYQDVLQCVREANKEGQLGWNRNEVMREANTLFAYCGRALQESRKRREWRDMLSLVKSELIEDPADHDPELMARLQANRQTAVKREKDLLDRYCEMSYLPTAECTEENDVYQSESGNESENDVEPETTRIQEAEKELSSQINNNISSPDESTGDKYKEMEYISRNLVNAVLHETNTNVNGATETHGVKKDVPKVVVHGSHVVKKRCSLITLSTSTKSPEVSSNIDPYNILHHKFHLLTKVVLDRIELPKNPGIRYPLSYFVKEENNKSESIKENDKSESKKENNKSEPINIETDLVNKVKKEPILDIEEELNNLGNNFTATVIDIEDPFLVVEISSDSEDEEDFT